MFFQTEKFYKTKNHNIIDLKFNYSCLIFKVIDIFKLFPCSCWPLRIKILIVSIVSEVIDSETIL